MRQARAFLGDGHAAEDVAQEAVLRAWRSQEGLREADRRVAWMARIVRNEAIRQRSRRLPDPADVAGLPDIAEDTLAPVAERMDVQCALERLGADDRRILLLRYELDLTQPAIAARLGMPEGTIKVRLHRARALLRRALITDGEPS